MPARIELYFSGAPSPELTKIIFVSPCPPDRIVACRANSRSMASFQLDALAGQFTWSRALQAATVLLLRTAAASRSSFGCKEELILSGGEGSLAAVLDEAVRREPNWLLDIFGVSERGLSNAKRIFGRATAIRATDYVLITVDQEFLPASRIAVYIDSIEVNTQEALYELSHCVEAASAPQALPKFNRSCAMAPRLKEPEHSESPVMCLDVEVNVTVLNAQGDGEICFLKTVENFGSDKIDSAAFDVWLDTPYQDFSVEAWDEDRNPLITALLKDDVLYKRVKIQLEKEIGPCCTGRYGYRYLVRNLFGERLDELNWWTLKIREPMACLSLNILDRRFRRLEQCMTIHESQDRQIVTDAVKTSVRRSRKGVMLSITCENPPLGHMFKTYWLGADTSYTGISDTDSARDKETSLVLS